MSVILEVEHVTTYRYAQPVTFGIHRVAFHPRAGHDIRVLNADLTVSPHSRQHWVHDVFSNSVAVVRAWVSSFLPQRGDIHTLDVLNKLNQFIRTDFAYAARDAMGTQRPAQTLALRSGTCRDFALLMIEAVRGLGMAARFVSGYIYAPTLDIDGSPATGQPVQTWDIGGMAGSGATHTWLHVYLPGAGWIPFDPTNTLTGGTDLVRVAFTRTPEQAAPVAGGWTGAANDYLGMEVSVSVRRRLGTNADTQTAT